MILFTTSTVLLFVTFIEMKKVEIKSDRFSLHYTVYIHTHNVYTHIIFIIIYNGTWFPHVVDMRVFVPRLSIHNIYYHYYQYYSCPRNIILTRVR